MKIHHIFHSGFMLEMEHSVLLFDWYTGELPPVPTDKNLFVFCSHAHLDHYSPAIWELQLDHPDVLYILDEGIEDAQHHPEAKILTVRPHECYAITGRVIRHSSPDELFEADLEQLAAGAAEDEAFSALRICTLESTDMGVAFYVETEGKRIYHAGDLNVWFWNDEPMEDNIASEKKCREEMQYLADQLRSSAHRSSAGAGPGNAGFPLDVAFVPLDPRLEEYGPKCVAAFMEILGAEYVFPMHYWEREEETRAYLKDDLISAYEDRLCFDPEVEI